MEIRIKDKVDLITLSNSYIGGLIKLNVTKLAKDLGTSRNTVSKYLNGFVPSKTRKREKYLDAYREQIIELLADKYRKFDYIDHLYETMKDKYDITCSRSTFNRYINNDEELSKLFRKSRKKGFTERFETAPGEQAQFDLKERVSINYTTGEKVRVNVATLTMSFSRYNVRRIVLDTKYETIVAFLADAFEEVGGVPKEIVIDNIKCLVDKPRKANGEQAILNGKFIEFLKDYDLKCFACMPRRPETKGKTETQNKKPSRLQNYNGEYRDLLDIHDKLKEITDTENTGISQATNLPRNFLLQKEKGKLSPLPSKRVREKYYLTLNEVFVTRDSLISYKSNKYSVPKRLIALKVSLIVINNELHIYYNNKIVAKHQISKNKFNILEEHDLNYSRKTYKNIEEDNVQILYEMRNITYDND